jgi:hypothetical protein
MSANNNNRKRKISFYSGDRTIEDPTPHFAWIHSVVYDCLCSVHKRKHTHVVKYIYHSAYDAQGNLLKKEWKHC